MSEVGGLRMWILHVIGEFGPSNGVEIMANVQKHYDLQAQWHKGTHIHPHHNVQSKRLLPGSVYPMLKKMVSEGLITKLDDGKYDLTENGKIIVTNLFEHFQQRNKLNRGVLSVENSLEAMNWHASYMEELDKEEIVPHEESIELLIERLKKIKESLK
ncbi:MAG: PadR family transcriptional regulator [Methanobacterium sp.]